MTTIGRTYTGPTHNCASYCDVCGVLWHRNELRRNSEGMLVCPDDSEGKNRLDCDRENAVGLGTSRVTQGGGRR